MKIPICGRHGDALFMLPLVEQAGPCEVLLQETMRGSGIAELFLALPNVEAVDFGDPHCEEWPWGYSWKEPFQNHLARRYGVQPRLTCQTLDLAEYKAAKIPSDAILVHTLPSEPYREWHGWAEVQWPLPAIVSGGGTALPNAERLPPGFFEVARIMKRCRLAVTVNSSHMGLANALGVPHITIYTSRDLRKQFVSTGTSLVNPDSARVTKTIRDTL